MSFLAISLAFLVLVWYSAGSDTPQTTTLDISFVYDISNASNAGVFYDSNTTTYETITEAFEEYMTYYAEEYNETSTYTDGIIYTEGVKAFEREGYIYPYQEVTDADLEVVPNVTQKYNLDGYDNVPNIVLLLVDDIGWNDFDLGVLESSMYRGDAFPAMKALMIDGGVTLTNHVSAAYCSPARGQLLTSKYSSYVNMDGTSSQLHLYEATLAQEMKSAGYYTAHFGKWGVGWTKYLHTPLYRGFDESFGFYGNTVHKYQKEIVEGDQKGLKSDGYTGSMVDLWENGEWAGNNTKYFTGAQNVELDSYLPMILSHKVQGFLEEHVSRNTSEPFFMYFASDLAHNPYISPYYYNDRCSEYAILNNNTDDDIFGIQEKCAMMLILDETIGNLTCKLESLGLADNTLIAFASDNGGDLVGDNYPYVGKKFYELQGGFLTPAAVFGGALPDEVRGTKYDNLFHGTDWMPTLMHAATNGDWTGSMLGDSNKLSGVDQWNQIIGAESDRPREYALTYVDDDGRMSLIGYHEDGLYHYVRGWRDLSDQEVEIEINVTGDSILTCDVAEVSWSSSGSMIEATKKMYLRARSSLLGVPGSTSPGATSAHIFVVILVAAVVLTVGALVFNSQSRKRTSLGLGMKTVVPTYGAFADELLHQ